jgi:hypothetical protein
MDNAAVAVMTECNNFFARLCERVSGCEAVGAAVTCASGWQGKYRPGDLLRIHGAFTGCYSGFGDGECYEVVSFDGETLTLDHELHTRAPWLFVVYCEPTGEFLELAAEIAAYEAKNEARRGLQSESIDGYSWSAGTTPTGASAATYQAAYADQLKPYRLPRPTRLYYAREAQSWR